MRPTSPSPRARRPFRAFRRFWGLFQGLSPKGAVPIAATSSATPTGTVPMRGQSLRERPAEPALLLCHPTRGLMGEAGLPPCQLHHPAHVRHARAGADRVLLRRLGDDSLGGEDVLRD